MVLACVMCVFYLNFATIYDDKKYTHMLYRQRCDKALDVNVTVRLNLTDDG